MCIMKNRQVQWDNVIWLSVCSEAVVLTTLTRLYMCDVMNLRTEIYKVVSEKQKLDGDDGDSSGDKVVLPSSSENAENKKLSCC